jgi:hypothetical protein
MVLGLATATTFRLRLDQKISTLNSLKQVLVFISISLINWYLSGAFMFEGHLSEGLGRYSSNFNTFINAREAGRLGPRFDYYGDGQGEGLAYLGLGVLVLFTVVNFYSLIIRKLNKDRSSPNKNQSFNIFFTVCLLFFVFALSPKWTLGGHLLIDWGYNDYISRTFRGTGRFSWPLFYFILYFCSLKLYQFNASSTAKYALVIGALTLQAFDLAPLWKRQPYIDEPAFRMAYIDQIRYLMSLSTKVVIYPPYSATIADFGDYIYFTDLAQSEKKPISTGYGARFPAFIGHAFRDSLRDMGSYLNRYPRDLIITNCDSVSLHQKWIKELKGVSFQFEHYRFFISDSFKNNIDFDRIDTGSLISINYSEQVALTDYLNSNLNHIVLGAVYEEGVSNLGDHTMAYLKQRGLAVDSLRFGCSWAFILKGQQVYKEASSMNSIVEITDTLACNQNQVGIQIKSGGYQAGKVVSISVNDEQLIAAKRGLSLVVLDSCGKVLDRVRYDSYLTDAYFER